MVGKKLTRSDILDVNRKTGALVLGNNRLDDYATKFLSKHCKQALLTPMPLPVEDIIESLKLTVKEVSLSNDLDIFGCCLLLDGTVDIYDKKSGGVTPTLFKKGTILIDPDSQLLHGEGAKRNTLVHELLHWEKDKTYFEILAIKNKEASEELYPILCRGSELYFEPSEGNKTKANEIKWLEWQAHRLAPRVLMPKAMFRQQALKYMEEDCVDSCDKLIECLCNFFIVSKQSAKFRLIEAGLQNKIEKYTDFDDVYQGIFEERDSILLNSDGSISIEDAFEIYRSDEAFRQELNTGHYRFIDGFFVLASDNYIDFENKSLTDYAKSHLSECSLEFGIRVVKEIHSDKPATTLYHRTYKFKRIPTFDSSAISFDKYNHENALQNIEKDFDKQFQRQQIVHESTTARFWEYIKAEKWNTSIFQDRTLLAPMDYKRVQDSTHIFKIPAYTAMAVGLKLSLNDTKDALRLSGLGYDVSKREHYAYTYILSAFQGCDIDECNIVLAKLGVKALGTNARK